jgi:glycosyltransferase involved in cell wall biosynthesis
MNVVLIHNQHPGGCHRRINEQVQHLDISVTEVTFEGAAPITDHPVTIPLTARDDSPHPLLRPATRYLDVASLMASYRRLAKVVRDFEPDVIWMNPCHVLQAMWVPEDLARRTVFYCDEPRRIDYEASLRNRTRVATRVPYWPLRQTTRYLDRSTFVHIRKVATNSEYTVEQLRKAYGVESEVVRCGVSARFRPPDGPVDRDHLLSVGNLIPTKGHDLAIAAAGRSGIDLPLVVVSHKPNEAEEQRLQSLADEAGVRLKVVIGASDEELVELYQTARVTLYLSFAEPFGLVSLEAQACGSPVIVSDEGGLPETIVPGATGWAVAREPGAVAERLAEFADTEVAAAFGTSAAAHTALGWSWTDSSDRLKSLLSEVAAS